MGVTESPVGGVERAPRVNVSGQRAGPVAACRRPGYAEPSRDAA
jgi:hypothetical protein